jgi:hypothetical protein
VVRLAGRLGLAIEISHWPPDRARHTRRTRRKSGARAHTPQNNQMQRTRSATAMRRGPRR